MLIEKKESGAEKAPQLGKIELSRAYFMTEKSKVPRKIRF